MKFSERVIRGLAPPPNPSDELVGYVTQRHFGGVLPVPIYRNRDSQTPDSEEQWKQKLDALKRRADAVRRKK